MSNLEVKNATLQEDILDGGRFVALAIFCLVQVSRSLVHRACACPRSNITCQLTQVIAPLKPTTNGEFLNLG